MFRQSIKTILTNSIFTYSIIFVSGDEAVDTLEIDVIQAKDLEAKDSNGKYNVNSDLQMNVIWGHIS